MALCRLFTVLCQRLIRLLASSWFDYLLRILCILFVVHLLALPLSLFRVECSIVSTATHSVYRVECSVVSTAIQSLFRFECTVVSTATHSLYRVECSVVSTATL